MRKCQYEKMSRVAGASGVREGSCHQNEAISLDIKNFPGIPVRISARKKGLFSKRKLKISRPEIWFSQSGLFPHPTETSFWVFTAKSREIRLFSPIPPYPKLSA
jgi:hypothetical protein